MGVRKVVFLIEVNITDFADDVVIAMTKKLNRNMNLIIYICQDLLNNWEKLTYEFNFTSVLLKCIFYVDIL